MLLSNPRQHTQVEIFVSGLLIVMGQATHPWESRVQYQ